MMDSVFSASEVPVTLPPGASMLSTRPEITGSVTAAKTRGMSVSSRALIITEALGEATATTMSTPSATMLAPIWLRTLWSPWALS